MRPANQLTEVIGPYASSTRLRPPDVRGGVVFPTPAVWCARKVPRTSRPKYHRVGPIASLTLEQGLATLVVAAVR